MASLKYQTITGALWKFAERISSQLVAFIVSIVLARILLPDDYGLIALVFVFTTFCDKLLIAGFATSLIQKKNADETDFSSVFFFSFFAAILLYSILFFCAPLIADYYTKFDRNELISVIRVLGLSLFVMAFNSVQHAYVSKNMLFRRYFWSTLGGTLVSGIVGISMAYMGFGVWALVAQNLSLAVVDTAILYFTVHWRPHFLFSFERLKSLFSYGWKIFVASIIKTIYNDVRSLVIGKVYSPSDLAFYNRGQSIPQLLETNIAGTIDSVLFPAYAKLQDDKVAMLSAVRRAVKTSCYILMPALALLAAVASPLISILLTDKWLPCVPFLQIIAFAFMFSPVELENLQAIKAIGRSDIVLKLEIVKKTIGIVLLIFAIPFGVKAIAWSMMASFLLFALINAIPNKKLLGYNLRSQLLDILPSILMSFVVFILVHLFVVFSKIDNNYVLLSLSLLIGCISYIALSLFFKIESFYYLIINVKGFISRQ